MDNVKKGFPTTDKIDSNENTKGEALEIGSDIEVKDAIEVQQEIAEQKLFDEPKSTALIAQEEAVLNSEEVRTLEIMRVFAKEVVKSGLSPFKREADVILVLIRGKELGLPYGVSVNNMFAINGKTGMSVHLHKALLQKAGVYFDLLEDFIPVYQFGMQKENATAGQPKVFVPVGTTIETKVEGFVVSPKIVDRQTTYYFEREIKMPLSGTIKTKKVTMSFRYSEAVKAGLTEKDVWVKYDRNLMKARAFTNGATEIASDVLQGLCSLNELALENGKTFTIDDNLEETITVDISHKEVN